MTAVVECIVVDVAPDGLMLRLPSGETRVVGSAGWEGILSPGQRVLLERGRVTTFPRTERRYS